MSRPLWAVLSLPLILGFIASGCGPVTATCDPATCNGCCDSNGECQPGILEAACGQGGLFCTRCLPGQFCIAGACTGITTSDGGTNNPDPDGGTGDGGTTTDGGTTCIAGGAACGASSQCCSLLCVGGTCSTCQAESAPCAGGCCAGLTCYRGQCSGCAAEGLSCTTSSDCCAGICNNGFCQSTCGEPGDTCASAGSCCLGQACPTGLGQCCVEAGLGCTTSAECCSGSCVNNLCQPSQPGQHCGSSADCATGTSCFNDLCCQPMTCAQLGATCGSVEDGCGGSIYCGDCTAPDVCGGGGTPNVCGCAPTTCAAQGKNCGVISDGCTGTLSCGTCTMPATCGGNGIPNVCGCVGTGCAPELLDVDAHSSVFNSAGYTRGFWFTAPISFTIVGLRVPTVVSGDPQFIEVVRFTAPPPVYSQFTNSFTSLGRWTGVAGTGFVPVTLPITSGDIIGILGLRSGSAGANTSYSPSYTYSTTIFGQPVTLQRLGMQYGLESTPAKELWTELAGSLGRVEVQYTP